MLGLLPSLHRTPKLYPNPPLPGYLYELRFAFQLPSQTSEVPIISSFHYSNFTYSGLFTTLLSSLQSVQNVANHHYFFTRQCDQGTPFLNPSPISTCHSLQTSAELSAPSCSLLLRFQKYILPHKLTFLKETFSSVSESKTHFSHTRAKSYPCQNPQSSKIQSWISDSSFQYENARSSKSHFIHLQG